MAFLHISCETSLMAWTGRGKGVGGSSTTSRMMKQPIAAVLGYLDPGSSSRACKKKSCSETAPNREKEGRSSDMNVPASSEVSLPGFSPLQAAGKALVNIYFSLLSTSPQACGIQCKLRAPPREEEEAMHGHAAGSMGLTARSLLPPPLSLPSRWRSSPETQSRDPQGARQKHFAQRFYWSGGLYSSMGQAALPIPPVALDW